MGRDLWVMVVGKLLCRETLNVIINVKVSIFNQGVAVAVCDLLIPHLPVRPEYQFLV